MMQRANFKADGCRMALTPVQAHEDVEYGRISQTRLNPLSLGSSDGPGPSRHPHRGGSDEFCHGSDTTLVANPRFN